MCLLSLQCGCPEFGSLGNAIKYAKVCQVISMFKKLYRLHCDAFVKNFGNGSLEHVWHRPIAFNYPEA